MPGQLRGVGLVEVDPRAGHSEVLCEFPEAPLRLAEALRGAAVVSKAIKSLASAARSPRRRSISGRRNVSHWPGRHVSATARRASRVPT